MKGIVKWFNDRDGYGFITAEDGTENVFVHFSEIQQKGFKSLANNQKVKFRMEKTEKGWQAKELEVLTGISYENVA